MNIKPLFVTEYAVLAPLLSAWAAEIKDTSNGVFFESDFQNLLFGGGGVLVAYGEANEPMGFIALRAERLLWRSELVWWEAGLFVLPEYRGKGIAKLLTKAGQDTAALNGYSRYMVAASSDGSDDPARFERIAEGLGYTLNAKVYEKRLEPHEV